MSKTQITCAGSATFDVLAKAAGPLPIGVLGLVDTFSTAEGGPALRTGRVLAGMGIGIEQADGLAPHMCRHQVELVDLDLLEECTRQEQHQQHHARRGESIPVYVGQLDRRH